MCHDIRTCMYSAPGTVILNVGGVLFATLHDTLTKYDSFFSGLLTTQSSSESIFVDRDPTHFRHILNYMRGTPTHPNDINSTEQLAQEAEFYSLVAFANILRKEIETMQKESIHEQLRLLTNKINF